MDILTTSYLCRTPKAIQKLISKLESKGFKVIHPYDLTKEYIFLFRKDTKYVDYLPYFWYEMYNYPPPKHLVEFKEED